MNFSDDEVALMCEALERQIRALVDRRRKQQGELHREDSERLAMSIDLIERLRVERVMLELAA
jgi:hypothetical protein